jgi:hypothetical protein
MTRAARRASALGVVILVALAGIAAGRVVGSRAKAQPADAFEAVDLDFRAIYSAARAAKLDGLWPVIVVEMDRLILLRGGARADASVIPPLYHRLKAVSHIPLAIYVALAPFGDAPPDEGRLGRLRELRARADEVSKALDGAGFSPEAAARSRVLLDRSAAFLDGVLADRKYEPARLTVLTRSLGPIVLANAADAARAQIDAYHAQVSAWRRGIPAEEWGRLRVVVMGPQMPRRHNLAVQYFAKLMGLPGESRRLVYAEELTGQGQALNLLSTHQLDSELSEAFFADPDRMEIDLLGNAASVYLDNLDLR